MEMSFQFGAPSLPQAAAAVGLTTPCLILILAIKGHWTCTCGLPPVEWPFSLSVYAMDLFPGDSFSGQPDSSYSLQDKLLLHN